MPERFELEYVSNDGTGQRPVMLHRAILGSVERFFGILIEHCAGKFPVWLAPDQAILVTVSEKQPDYALKVQAELKARGLRLPSISARTSSAPKSGTHATCERRTSA